MSEFDPKRILNSLPLKPGVYQMLGQDDEVLYVGKAKKLKNRVSSYFSRIGSEHQDHGAGEPYSRYPGNGYGQ